MAFANGGAHGYLSVTVLLLQDPSTRLAGVAAGAAYLMCLTWPQRCRQR